MPQHLKALKSDHKNVEDGRVHIFTDGSCDRKDGSGGWGAYLRCDGYERQLSGAVEDTTIGAMEMQAVLEAVRALRSQNRPVIIYSDSQYVVQALTIWWRGWERKGWVTSSGTPVKHVEMLMEILERSRGKPIAFRWIKGHAGIYGNEEADRLAGTSRKEMVMVNLLKEQISKMGDLDTTEHTKLLKQIAERHIEGLYDVLQRDSRGWGCKPPIMLWTYYLVLSYMYYERDHNMIPDAEYDKLCQYLQVIGPARLKEAGAYWIDKLYSTSSMEAGTGFHLHKKYPLIVSNIAETMMRMSDYRAIDGDTNLANYLNVPNSFFKTTAPTRQRLRTRTAPPIAEPVAPPPSARQRVRTRTTGETTNATVPSTAPVRVRQRTRSR